MTEPTQPHHSTSTMDLSSDSGASNKKPLGITDVVLRDAHQSLLATRMRLEDMLPIAPKLDQVGYWSLESWGGATFDSCIRFLGEDPWERIRQLKKAMPNTPQQMLLRGQNLLGYRHYADDVVDKFVERAAANGVEVFRVFDAMNDPRNLQHAMQAVKREGQHAQGTMSYTTSPVHSLETWIELAQKIEEMGADSLAIKDMAGTLTPYAAFELVTALKSKTDLELHLHAHATSGLSDMTILKAVEAGIDRVDTAISSMAMTYGHTATESVVAALQGTERDTGLNLTLIEEIALYFREVRKKYAHFEGALRGTDSRILVAQVPGGMLTNMEKQLKEQGAADRFDEVLEEIPRVRKDLGYIPLVTPTSQIVGTQAVLNILTGERYKSISKETAAVIKGEYGLAPAPYDEALSEKILAGQKPLQCRPADQLAPEFEKLSAELVQLAQEKNFKLAAEQSEDVLIYALFQQIGTRFLENRGNPDAFEPAPQVASEAADKIVDKVVEKSATTQSSPGSQTNSGGPEVYTIKVNGASYVVEVEEGGDIQSIHASAPPVASAPQPAASPVIVSGDPVLAPLAGNIFKVMVSPGQVVHQGDVLIILEAMKMETEIVSPRDGAITDVNVTVGDSVAVGDILLRL